MRVRGTQKAVKPVEVNVDTVYVRTNIKWVDNDDFEGWEYDEVQMPLHYFIEEIKQESNDLGVQLFNAQTEVIKVGADKDDLGQSLFNLQTQLLVKGVI